MSEQRATWRPGVEQRVLIVGTTVMAERIIAAIDADPTARYCVLGIVS